MTTSISPHTIDGYGFFPDVKFHDSQDAQKNTWSISGSSPRTVTASAGDPNLQGTAEGGRKTGHHGASAEKSHGWDDPASEPPGHLATSGLG